MRENSFVSESQTVTLKPSFRPPEVDERLPDECLPEVVKRSRSGEASAPRDCLLAHAPQALFICLLRFRYGDSVEKVRTAIALPDYVDIPLMGSEGVVTFATYRCAALILHHGDSPYHGHYTALLCHLPSTASSSTAGHWLLDDARIPRAVSSSEASKLSASDMYMLCLVKRDRGVRS